MKKLLLLVALAVTFTACSKDESTDPNTKYCVECNIKTTIKQTGEADALANTEYKACEVTIAYIDAFLQQGNTSITSTANGFTSTYKTETTCTKTKH